LGKIDECDQCERARNDDQAVSDSVLQCRSRHVGKHLVPKPQRDSRNEYAFEGQEVVARLVQSASQHAPAGKAGDLRFGVSLHRPEPSARHRRFRRGHSLDQTAPLAGAG